MACPTQFLHVIPPTTPLPVADHMLTQPTDDTQTPAACRPRVEEPVTPEPQTQTQRRVLTHNPFGGSPPAAAINFGAGQDDGYGDSQEMPSSHLTALFTSLGVAGDHEKYAGELAEVCLPRNRHLPNQKLTHPTLLTHTPQMGPSERAATLITTIAGMAKCMEEISQLIAAAPAGFLSTGIEPISPLTHEEQVRAHVYSAVFKQFICKAAHKSMLDEGLEEYHTNQQERSLFRAVINKLKLQSPPFKRKQLPPKYLQDNNLATSHVNSHVKTQLKHVRHKARNVLMIGVTPTANFPHIPPLNELCRLLWRHFMNGNNTTSDKQIDKLLEPGRCCAWDRIMGNTDASLFATLPAMADIDRRLLVCPTDEEEAGHTESPVGIKPLPSVIQRAQQDPHRTTLNPPQISGALSTYHLSGGPSQIPTGSLGALLNRLARSDYLSSWAPPGCHCVGPERRAHTHGALQRVAIVPVLLTAPFVAPPSGRVTGLGLWRHIGARFVRLCIY
ncbi:hypothetical protein PCASD_11403 [Puccinia coronata f. sp. avenae]|uniref:Uncharacterized protein n=1 Tax=Puccinia coronata f. sp. avenae TaxID=200324 RepID=A0A2N5TDK3_9BASI|nr:hypothetical protein PCASD_11403 [Puccinia coronata f. sp. avenae]